MKSEDFAEIKLYVFVTYFLIAGLLTGFLTSLVSVIGGLGQYDGIKGARLEYTQSKQ